MSAAASCRSDPAVGKCALVVPESSHEIGPFRFNRAPYLEEPQNESASMLAFAWLVEIARAVTNCVERDGI